MYPGIPTVADPGRPAVVLADSGRTVTYGELDTSAARFARVLHDRGLTRGSVVAMLADNAAECFAVYRAAVTSGLCVVPVDPDLSLEEVAYVVNDSGARALVVSARRSQLATALRPLTPCVEARYVFDGVAEGHEPFEAAIAGAPGRWQEFARGAEMVYTSGITGRPRGVTSTLGASDPYRERLSAVLRERCGVDPSTVYFSTVPLSQAFALQVAAEVLAAGGTVVTAAEWSAEDALETVARHRVSVAHFVPTQLADLLALPAEVRRARNVASLRAVLHTGAPCPSSVKQRMLRWLGPVVHEFYSCAERNGFTFASASTWQARPGTAGRAEIGVLRVCGDDGDELPAGEYGTVYFERPQVPFVYHHAPESTAAALHPSHPTWTTVGDIGRVEDGYLYLAGPKAFVVTTSGRRIHPGQIEDLLMEHSAVADAAVVGVPGDARGQQLKAVVRLADGVDPSAGLERELLAGVGDKLAEHLVPHSVDFVAELPRTTAGKLAKRTLTRRYTLADSVIG